MQILRKAATASVLSAMLLSGTAFAQDDHHDDHGKPDQGQGQHDQKQPGHGAPHAFVQHKEWKKGHAMRHEDWDRGERIDYAQYHLRQPPSGYEWREVDGNYVLAAVATGLIASVVIASTVR